jgi:hypothetical protein
MRDELISITRMLLGLAPPVAGDLPPNLAPQAVFEAGRTHPETETPKAPSET